MAAEDILKDLPRTEDSRRLVLQWLDESMGGERNRLSGEEALADPGDGSIDSEAGHSSNGNGSTASRGGPRRAENGSTASRGGPRRAENGSTASRGGPSEMGNNQPEQMGERSTASHGGPPRKGLHLHYLVTPRAKTLQILVLAHETVPCL